MGESLDSTPNSERHRRMTERATAALGVRSVTPSSSQVPEASIRPASSQRPATLDAAPAASWRRTSEANEDSLAHLPRQQVGVVPDASATLLREQVPLPDAEAHLAQGFPVDRNRRGILGLVTGEGGGRETPGMDENVGYDGPDMIRNRPHVVGDRKATRFPPLRHHVGDVDDGAVKVCQGLPQAAAEEGWDRARKQATGTEHEH